MRTIIALAIVLLSLGRVDAAEGALTGKMTNYNALLGGEWTCSAMGATYYANFDVAPGNTLHGRLYSKNGSEDTYYGYDAKGKLYWIDDADSNGATEWLTSTDGLTYAGTLNSAGSITKASDVETLGAKTWILRARGTAGGQPYDVTATCRRK